MVAQNEDETKHQQLAAGQPDLCHLSCNALVDQRNRYYTGKYMTARDFQDEQDYFLNRHRLHNRLLHGWGIVCGLTVSQHPNPDCRDRYVVVSPGIAIDCCGRELTLKDEVVFQIWEPEPVSKDRLDQAQQEASKKRGEEEDWDDEAEEKEEDEDYDAEPEQRAHHKHKGEEIKIEGGPFLLTLNYDEKGIELMPALYAEGACDPRKLEANRVQELACLEVHRWDKDRHAGCWPITGEDNPKERIACRDDCNEKKSGMPGCIEADCPCAFGVPLALVTPVYQPKVKKWEITERWIGWEGRREMHTPPEVLTHIIDYNWSHGGEVRLSELANPDKMDGKLKVYFDRRLYEDSDDKGRGINEHTFVVTYHRQADVAYPLQVLFSDGNPPYVENEEGRCAAVFPIDYEMLRGDVNIGNSVLYVTLKCDFILDCHHRPVDGDHLAGRTPTGNGMAGGNFESWFRVIDDEREYRHREKERQRSTRYSEEQGRRRPLTRGETE